jgi:hypothetical protein
VVIRRDPPGGLTIISDPFDRLSCEEEINPKHWREETRLHTPTFEALMQADGPLYLSGSVLQEGISVEAHERVCCFRSERIQLPPAESPYDVEGFTPKKVEEECRC